MEGTSKSTIQTTLGELIEAVTQIALEAGKTEAEGYKLASLTLERMLEKKHQIALEETVLS